MQKRFNTTGCCNPEWHYMVDISGKLAQIKTMIDNGCYFTINRARQFGKTTSIELLYKQLINTHTVIMLSFESDSEDTWKDTISFCNSFVHKLIIEFGMLERTDEKLFWEKEKPLIRTFDDLSVSITKYCQASNKPVVLMIDEVDKSQDNQLFLSFLGMLRNKYLKKSVYGHNSTFHSVILAGVYDVKNLKLKLRPNEERKYNSPWNIATDFKVDMSFCPTEIETMLNSYETDHKTGMDIPLIANEIYKYTSGYPFLVSKICELIDTELNKDWSILGILNAIKIIENNDECTLIDSLIKNIENDSEMKSFLKEMLLNNVSIEFNANIAVIKKCKLFSILKAGNNGNAIVHNHIFERVLYNYFITEKKIEILMSDEPRSLYIKDNKLNLPLIIERFQYHMRSEYRKSDEQFIEKQGRLLFLCFLKPIINGKGFYYVEPQTRENNRMDIVVTYGEQEFVIELKIWRGEKYEIEGKEQLSEYLATRNLNEGYLVTFSFLKNKVVQEEPQWIEHNGKRIYEAVI